MSVISNCIDLIDSALIDNVAGIDFLDIILRSTMKGRSNEQIARKEYSQRYKEPLGADKDNTINLILALTARCSQQFLCLHYILLSITV